ncbi:MAG: hypothetical protein GY832_15025 [Chloroflexi bacterium]|nr:hypothetical protein [Chloroflexota bacterium]
MNHDQVCWLIIDTAAATANGSAAASSSSSPPPALRSSDTATTIVATNAKVYPSPTLPSRQLHQNPRPPTYLSYDERGMQVDLMGYRRDTD